jgi:transcription termination factor Rho
MKLFLKNLKELGIWSFNSAIDVPASGTRREDLLMSREELQRVWILRKYMDGMNSSEAMDFLMERMRGTMDNREFLLSMNN